MCDSAGVTIRTFIIYYVFINIVYKRISFTIIYLYYVYIYTGTGSSRVYRFVSFGSWYKHRLHHGIIYILLIPI